MSLPSEHPRADPGTPSGLPPGPAPVLRTPRLLLRPFRTADAAAMQAYASSPGFFRYITDVPAAVRSRYTIAHAREHILELRKLQAEGYPSWAIVPAGALTRRGARRTPGPAGRVVEEGGVRAAGDEEVSRAVPVGPGAPAPAPIGAIRLNCGAGRGVPDLGYGLAADWRGKGLALEAARAVLAWVDTQIPLLGAVCLPENAASRRVLERAGFTLAGEDAGGRLIFQRSSGRPLALATKP